MSKKDEIDPATKVQGDEAPTSGNAGEAGGDAAAKPKEPETEKSPPIEVKFKLGEVVRYVRLNPENEVEKGVGKVVAVLLDHTFRPVYRIKDGEKVFNADSVALNADEATEEAYLAHGRDIREYTQTANAAVKKLTDEANAEIEARHTAVLGAPLTL